MSSFYLCNSVALQADLSKMAFKVYSFLSLGANNQTRSCFHSKGTIAKHCKISPSSVVRASRELCEKGLLEVKKRTWGNGRQTSNLYILLDNPQLKLDATKHAEEKKTNPQSNDASIMKAPQKDSQTKLWIFKCSTVAFHANLSPNELKVYSYLSLRAGNAGQCLPSKKEIAGDCRISVSTVSRAIKQMSQLNLLEVRPQTRKETCGNNGTSVNLYVLNPAIPKEPDTGNHAEQDYRKVCLLASLLSLLTPSPLSPATPHRTKSRKKVTLKQRNNRICSKIIKRYTMHKHKKIAGKALSPAFYYNSS